MAGRIEWMDADAIEVQWVTEPGDITSGHVTNTGTALRLGNVVIEGPVEELEDLVVRMEQAISEIKDELGT